MLTQVQVQELLNLLFLKRIERERVAHAHTLEARDLQPIYAPFAPVITTLKSLSARPGLALVVLVVVAMLLWLVL